jgi:hypothetical protein
VPELLPISLPSADFSAVHTIAVDVINSFKDSPEIASDKLIKLYSPHDTSEVVVNVTSMQAVFGELMKLPKPQEPLAFYSSLLIRLASSTAADNTYITLVNRAALELLNKAAVLDLEAAERVCKVLAHFVSNFEATWKWDDFAELDLTEDQDRFIKDWFDQLGRIVSLERLSQDIPDRLKPLLPAEPEPKLRFTDIEESVENTDCQLIIDRINSKATTQMMKTLLTSKEICNSGNFLYLIFCQCLFFQGAKSFTHISTYIARYLDVLKTISSSVVLEALYEVWGDALQRTEVIIVKLIKVGVVSLSDLAAFVLKRLKEDSLHNLNKSEWRVLGFVLEEHRHKSEDLDGLLSAIASQLTPADYPRMVCFLRQHIQVIEDSALATLEGRLEGSIRDEIGKLRVVKGLF